MKTNCNRLTDSGDLKTFLMVTQCEASLNRNPAVAFIFQLNMTNKGIVHHNSLLSPLSLQPLNKPLAFQQLSVHVFENRGLTCV